MKNGLTINVTLRKRDTGWRVWAFQTEDLNGARTAAQILVDAPTFRNCYAVATDWQGEIMFECRPSEMLPPQVPPQVPHGTYPQMRYSAPQALPQYAPPPPPRVSQVRQYETPSHHAGTPYGARHAYGPPPVVQEIVVEATPVRSSLGARDAYGPPPAPYVPKMLGRGR